MTTETAERREGGPAVPEEAASASHSPESRPETPETPEMPEKTKREVKRSRRVAEKAAARVAASHAAKAKDEKKAEKLGRLQQKEAAKLQEMAAADNHSQVSMYDRFCAYSFIELEQLLRAAETREEKAFYRSLLNLKLQIEQEKVIGEVLL